MTTQNTTIRMVLTMDRSIFCIGFWMNISGCYRFTEGTTLTTVQSLLKSRQSQDQLDEIKNHCFISSICLCHKSRPYTVKTGRVQAKVFMRHRLRHRRLCHKSRFLDFVQLHPVLVGSLEEQRRKTKSHFLISSYTDFASSTLRIITVQNKLRFV